MKKQRSAGAVIYYDQDEQLKYLLLRYKGGYWDLAKGKLEAGETDKQAALRETKEETDLDVEIKDGFDYTLTYTFRERSGAQVDKTVCFFVAQAPTKKVRLSHEHLDYTWLPFEEAHERLTYENARDLLRQAHSWLNN